MAERQVISVPLLHEEAVRFTHRSGLRVHLIPKEFSTTYVSLGVAFGSLDICIPGSPDILLPAGTAHYLEHKMFDMPDGTDALDLFAALGANANAFTANEYTAYVFYSNERFEECLQALLRFVTTPHFSQQAYAKEKGIIAQEIAAYEDDPSAALYMRTISALYPTHPIRNDICGTRESISQISPALLKAAYEYYYTPSNMVLTVVGRYDEQAITEILDCVLPRESSPAPLRRLPVVECGSPSADNLYRMDIVCPRFSIGYRDAVQNQSKLNDRRGYALDIACAALFSRTGDLYRTLYRKGLIGRDFSAVYEWSWGCGHLLISSESERPEDAVAYLRDYLMQIGEHMPSEEDFLRVRNAVYADTVRVFDSPEDIAAADVEQAMCAGDFFAHPDLIRSLTYPYFCETLQSMFTQGQSACVILKPEV